PTERLTPAGHGGAGRTGKPHIEREKHMTTFTLDDLVLIMRAGGGADREELEGDILDMPFGDLGYD
ncbi:hypothetical protein, partial [Escherichia coli]|uniref:hypothetical protein n=1 Tax=Escherichia coli TaxID=562 RepID=UPI003BA142A4